MNTDLDLVVSAFTKSAAEYGEDRDKDKKGRGETSMPSPDVLWLESTADVAPEKAKPKEAEPKESENDDVEYTDKRSSLASAARSALNKSAMSGSVSYPETGEMVKVVATGDNKGKVGTISGIKEARSSTDTIEDDGTEVRKSKETKTVTVDLNGGGTYTTDSCKSDLNYHDPHEKSSGVFAFNPFSKQALREIERPNVMQRFNEGAGKGALGGGLVGAGLGTAHGLVTRRQAREMPIFGEAFADPKIQRQMLLKSILGGLTTGASVGGLGMGVGQAALGARERPGAREFSAKDLAAEPGEIPSATKKEPKPKPETVKQALREMEDRGVLERLGAGATQGGIGGAGVGAGLGALGGALSKIEEGSPYKERMRRVLTGAGVGGIVGGGVGASGGAIGEGLLGDRKKLGDELELQTGKRTPRPQGVLGGLGNTIGGGLETIGGGSMRGLGAVLGKLGLGGAQGKLNEWSDDPTTSKWVGGGVTAAGTLAAALLAKKYLGKGDEEEDYGDDMYAEAAFHGAPPMQKVAGPDGVALSVKHAIFGGGSAASPVHKEENNAAKGGSDWRRGLTQRSGHRQTNFDRTANWSVGK